MISFVRKPQFKITVINKKHKLPTDGVIVPIHRPSPSGDVKGSILGNPYHLKNPDNDHERNKACDLYEVWLENQIKEDNPEIITELHRILDLHNKHKKVYLACMCKPKRCHGDTIVKVLREKWEAYY